MFWYFYNDIFGISEIRLNNMILYYFRILTQSFGKTSPTVEMWHQVRSMEEERKVRLSKQQRNVNPPQNNV